MPSTLAPSYDMPLPKWLTVYLPLAIILYPLLLAIPGWNWEATVYREFGLIENLTVLFLALAFYWSCRALSQPGSTFRFIWLLLLAAGAFVFLGEEISWGQHFGKWTTPAEWSEVNRQRETNLHNVKGWSEFIFTTLARNGLCVGALVGSILGPWWARRGRMPSGPACIKFWLFPAAQTALVAVLLNLSVVPRKVARKILETDLTLPYYGHEDGEMKEVLIALFIMLYAYVQARISLSRPAQD